VDEAVYEDEDGDNEEDGAEDTDEVDEKAGSGYDDEDVDDEEDGAVDDRNFILHISESESEE